MPITGKVLSLIQTNYVASGATSARVLAGTGGNNGWIYYSDDDGLNWTGLVALGDTNTRVNAMIKDGYGNIWAAVDGSANPNYNGIWKGGPTGGWLKNFSHPSGTGYLDIAIFQSGTLMMAVGHPTTSAFSPVVVSINGQPWQYVATGDYNKTHMSAASFIEPFLGSTYPGETNPSNWFYGIDGYYTSLRGVGGLYTPINNGYSSLGGGAGNGGLDMAGFLEKNTASRYYRKILWAVKSAADITDTEIWQWPASPTSLYNFVKIATIDNEIFNVLYPEPVFPGGVINELRTVWAGGNGKIFVSYNSGLTWVLSTDAPVSKILSFVRTTTGVMIAGGENGEIYRFTGGGTPITPPVTPETPPTDPTEPGAITTRFLGRTETTDNEVYVGNKIALSTITIVKHYNGLAYSNLQFAEAPPYYLLGNPAAIGKITYFGSLTSDANVPGGPFSSIVVDITQEQRSLTVTWEYWNGSTWAALTVFDNSDSFKLTGVHSIHWHPPSGWTTTSVNGVTGYWVRVRVTGVGASPQYPIHDNRYIYTVLNPYVEVGENTIQGDLPAATRVQWHNRADNSTSSTAMEIDRMVIGLRTVDRGLNFQAYLNVSDVQSPFGVTVALGASAAWQTDKTAPTARSLVVSYASAPSLDTWADLASFTLTNTVAREYYGSFRAFVRVFKSSGAANVWQVRLRTTFGSGGSYVDSKVVFPTSLADWEVLDFGQISIPTTQVSQQAGNLGDQLKISIQGKCSATSSALVLYDLILIPVDEWAIDARPPRVEATMFSQVKSSNYLDVDSITNPKALLTVLNRNEADLIVSRYQAINNGPAILQAGRQQRIWFLGMATTGSYWYGYPSLAGTVRVFRQQRYMVLRGTS